MNGGTGTRLGGMPLVELAAVVALIVVGGIFASCQPSVVTPSPAPIASPGSSEPPATPPVFGTPRPSPTPVPGGPTDPPTNPPGAPTRTPGPIGPNPSIEIPPPLE
jgi:hypothetical protein